ncbi:hypothetical protein J6590_076789 [Homalodisca vitripennis]|nr:hypothetical protein J6590_076789 [Homalodisca vitripennis]
MSLLNRGRRVYTKVDGTVKTALVTDRNEPDYANSDPKSKATDRSATNSPTSNSKFILKQFGLREVLSSSHTSTSCMFLISNDNRCKVGVRAERSSQLEFGLREVLSRSHTSTSCMFLISNDNKWKVGVRAARSSQ